MSKTRPSERATICPYNDGIGCYDTTQCRTCGWNPAEARRRATSEKIWIDGPGWTKRLYVGERRKDGTNSGRD